MHIIYMVVLCTWIALQLPLRVLYQRCVDIFRQEWNISQRIFRPNRPIWWTGFIEENMQHRTTYQLSLLWTVTFLMPIFGDGNTISARCHSTCLSAHVSMPLVQPLHGIAYCHWSSATERVCPSMSWSVYCANSLFLDLFPKFFGKCRKLSAINKFFCVIFFIWIINIGFECFLNSS